METCPLLVTPIMVKPQIIVATMSDAVDFTSFNRFLIMTSNAPLNDKMPANDNAQKQINKVPIIEFMPPRFNSRLKSELI